MGETPGAGPGPPGRQRILHGANPVKEESAAARRRGGDTHQGGEGPVVGQSWWGRTVGAWEPSLTIVLQSFACRCMDRRKRDSSGPTLARKIRTRARFSPGVQRARSGN